MDCKALALSVLAIPLLSGTDLVKEVQFSVGSGDPIGTGNDPMSF